MAKYAMESVTRGQDNLAALKREDGNRSDRYAVIVVNDRAIVAIVP